jgi:hypothetical protein
MPIKYDDHGHIKRPGLKIEYDTKMISEYAQSANSVIYFAENFYRIIHAKTGAQLIKLRDYQKKLLSAFESNTKVIVLSSRQSGKCQSFDTLITIKDNETGEEQEITIGHLFDLLYNEDMK